MTDSYLKDFLRGYVETALWSSDIGDDFARSWNEKTGEGWSGDTSMMNFGFTADDVDPETLESMRRDCLDFIEGAREDLDAYGEAMGTWHGSDSVRGAYATYNGAEQAGDDFWLTRNGHGAGFWDRGLGELGDLLSAKARPYGESYLHVGDDEKIHGG